MSVRKIEYAVDVDGISPAAEQFGGTQGDHRVCELQFTLSHGLYGSVISKAGDGKAVYRFECYDGEGIRHIGDIADLTQPEIAPFPLEVWLTKHGGKIKVYLVISVLESNCTQKELYSFPAALYLKDRPWDASDDGEYQSLALLADVAKKNADSAINAAAAADEKYQKTATLSRALESGFKIICDGGVPGDTHCEADVKFVVDRELNDTSDNAVANRVLKAELDNLERDIRALKDNLSALDKDGLIADLTSALGETIHPVGSYYISENDTNPSTLFGGEWERLTGRFLFAGFEENKDYVPGTVGGEYEHTLDIKEMPSHDHQTVGGSNSYFYYGDNWNPGVVGSAHFTAASTATVKDTPRTSFTGGGAAHNNMPPFRAVYIWYRTR